MLVKKDIIEGSYFEVLPQHDSINVLVGNDYLGFRQQHEIWQRAKKREPNHLRSVGLLFPRDLKFSDDIMRVRIKNLKIVEIKNDTIIAEANVKRYSAKQSKKGREQISIPRSELKGVFVGGGERERKVKWVYTAASITLMIVMAVLQKE